MRYDALVEGLRRQILVAALGACAVAGCKKESVTAGQNVCGAKGKPAEGCFAPFANARSQGTGEPAPAPPPSAYDMNGCLPKELVTDGCCNAAVTGPRVANGQCCYDFCVGSCCGRPFVVEGRARLAGVRHGTAWIADVAHAPRLRTLDERTRAALHEAWLGDARMEHASIAAFGRFVLQLLALGAPPDLVRGAAEAAIDEARHAELCFALAARIGGVALGPSPLPLDGVLGDTTPAAVIADVVVEGCIGETIAALLAARQLENATDPATRAVLETIAKDEARHAELAWRFLRWALDTFGDPAQQSASAALSAALSRTVVAPKAANDAPLDPEAWSAFGRLTAKETQDILRSALRDLIEPATRALLHPTDERMERAQGGRAVFRA